MHLNFYASISVGYILLLREGIRRQKGQNVLMTDGYRDDAFILNYCLIIIYTIILRNHIMATLKTIYRQRVTWV